MNRKFSFAAVATALTLTAALLVAPLYAYSEAAAAQSSSADSSTVATFDFAGEYAGATLADDEAISLYGETVASTEPDETCATAMNGGILSIIESTLEKTGDAADVDQCDKYGINSTVLAAGEASTAYVQDSTLSADSAGSNALFATDGGTLYANNTTATSSGEHAGGIAATFGGVVVGNELTIETTGDSSAGVTIGQGKGAISLTSTTLATTGANSPILSSAGDLEIDNITGTAAKSQIASLDGPNSIFIANSKLTSIDDGSGKDGDIASSITIYQSTDDEIAPEDFALFQATDSTLSSALESGALFYLTNTQAKIVLSNTSLDFDSDDVNLIVASGTDDNASGQAESNGATATFTGISQTLKGDIEVDSVSSLDFYLLSSSSWTGSADITITDSSSSSTNADHLDVSIDSKSSWIVTEDSTVSNLDLASGAKLVDAEGKAVKVADADGNVLVEGASSVTVFVTDDFSTSISTSAANELESTSIDRTTFDETFGTSTVFGENGSAGTDSVEQQVEATKQAVLNWFANLA